MQRFNLLPVVIKNLIIINGLFFLGTISLYGFGIDLNRLLGLYLPNSQYFQPFQFITHFFMHADWGHIFFNMFALWMFGYALENIWGPKKFLNYYLITGLGAAVLHMLIKYIEFQTITAGLSDLAMQSILSGGEMRYLNTDSISAIAQAVELLRTPTIGASGAVFGILLAFGMLFPNQPIFFIFLPIPIKAKYFVAGYGALELFNGLANDPSSSVAHFAHLGGMLFGFLLLRYWKAKTGSFY